MSTNNVDNRDNDDDFDAATPSASELLNTPSGASDDDDDIFGSSGADEAPLVDDDDGFGPDDNGLDDGLDDDLGGGPDDEDEDEEEDDDNVTTTTPSGSTQEKKTNKLKSYALIAGMGTFVVGILGAGYVLTQPPSAPNDSQGVILQATAGRPAMPVEQQRNPRTSGPAVKPESAPTSTAPQTSKPSQPVAEEASVAPRVIAPAGAQSVAQVTGQMDLAPAARIEQRPIDVRPSAAMASLSEQELALLTEKTDLLAGAFTQLKDQSEKRADALQTTLEQTVAPTLDAHEKRIQALEEQIKQLSATLDDLKEKGAAPKRRASAPKKAQETKLAAKPAVKSEPQKSQPQAAASSRAATGIGAFTVVATYPSTQSEGLKPQKAWITNGEKLVQVVVGSVVNGARITRIEGTTVHTSRGVIRSPR